MAKKEKEPVKVGVVKSTKEHTITKKRSGRYAVQNAAGQYLKADEKIKVLLDNKLIKLTPAKKKEEPAPAEAAATTEATPATETPAS